MVLQQPLLQQKGAPVKVVDYRYMGTTREFGDNESPNGLAVVYLLKLACGHVLGTGSEIGDGPPEFVPCFECEPDEAKQIRHVEVPEFLKERGIS